MRSLLLLSLGALIVGTLVAVGLVEGDAGYVLLAYDQTTVEMTLWTGAALLAALFALGALGLWLISSVFRTPGKVSSWGRGRLARADQRRINQAQIAFVEGHWESARQQLAAVARRAELPLVNYLISAEASDRLGDDAAVQEALGAAEASEKKSRLAVALTEATLQVRKQQWDKALATLMRVRALSAPTPAALRLLIQIYQGQQDLASLLKLLPQIDRAGALTSAESLALESKIYCALLEREGVDRHRLQHAWKQVPKHLAADPDLVSLYVEKLRAIGEEQQGERILRAALPRSWDERLIALYGKVQGGDAAQQLATVEAWLEERGDAEALLLCAGRLAMANRQWDRAESYFRASLKRRESPAALAELGRLLSYKGEKDESLACFQRGLLASVGGLPHLPVPPAGNQQVVAANA